MSENDSDFDPTATCAATDCDDDAITMSDFCLAHSPDADQRI